MQNSCGLRAAKDNYSHKIKVKQLHKLKEGNSNLLVAYNLYMNEATKGRNL